MAHDVELIRKAVSEAIAHGAKFAGTDDGGTCNFDSCYIRVTGMRKTTANTIWGTFLTTSGWHGRILHLSGTLGQGARRTKMAEEQKHFLQANYPQLEVGMYYQMD
jgi:hypothetical protein